jgi:putative cell wall-binding protein
MHRKRIILSAVVAACVAFAILPTMAFAIPRDVVINRGKVWVNYTRTVAGKKVTGVPYSQSKWALENGNPVPTSTPSPSTAGYRTDCSGFVSLAYNLRDSKGRPYSECTAGFGAKGSTKYFEIKKSQLQVGDMMLASAVWGAPGPHAIIFAGWVDAAQTQFWAMEQTTYTGHNGTVLRARSYPPDKGRYANGKSYYKPYRYSGLEDPYIDCQETVSGVNAYSTAASASLAAYPGKKTPVAPAVVIASGAQWGDQLSGASLAGAVGGPLLLTAASGLPASTTAELKRIKPTRAYLIGSTATISSVVASQCASMGISISRVNAVNRYQASSRLGPITVAANKAAGRTTDYVYLVPGAGTPEALAIAPIAAKLGRPIIYTEKNAVPKDAMTALGKMGVKKIIIIGGSDVVSRTIDKKLKKLGYNVERLAGKNRYATSAVVASYALRLKVGFTWARAGLATPDSCGDALAAARLMGATNSLILTTPVKTFDPAVRAEFVKHRAEIGKVRIFGTAASSTVRKSLATALRNGR